MATIEWDATGDRIYETGVDHGVLYVRDSSGDYTDGVPWNGLTAVNQTPSGGEPSPQYADNIKYLNLISNEEFGCTIEAFTYPDEFAECDGSAEPYPGVKLSQQPRKTFGFSYRTLVGNDTDGNDYGYKIHMVWGAMAAPSEKGYSTINDSPEATTFSWSVTTTPVAVTGFKPLAHIAIDSSKVDAEDLETLESQLYGSEILEPELPSPSEVLAIFSTSP